MKDRSLDHIDGSPDEIALALHNDAVSRPYYDHESAEYYDEIGKDEAYWIKQHEQEQDDREE